MNDRDGEVRSHDPFGIGSGEGEAALRHLKGDD